MASRTTRYEDDHIEDAILAKVDAHPSDLARVVAAEVGASRPTVIVRIRRLIELGYLESTGGTRPTYSRGPSVRKRFLYPVEGLAEDVVWREDVRPLLDDVPTNVLAICEHGVTEMVNNAIDHSGSVRVTVFVDRNRSRIAFVVDDDGIGIFRKITEHLRLTDERQALFELAKGKLTTDPARHTGEGVFFSSRMFDRFQIMSGSLVFDHQHDEPDDVLVEANVDARGTSVVMSIGSDSDRDLADVFAEYSSGPDDYAFAKTIVPVRLARLGTENLVSRSQARRVLQRVEQFRSVVLDFSAVDVIGQAFADEIFRVFANAHPAVELVSAYANPAVQQMIRRAQSAQAALFE